jgi:hypothetical protein
MWPIALVELKLVRQIKIHARWFSEERPWLKTTLFRGLRSIVKQPRVPAPHRCSADGSIRQDIHEHDYLAV